MLGRPLKEAGRSIAQQWGMPSWRLLLTVAKTEPSTTAADQTFLLNAALASAILALNGTMVRGIPWHRAVYFGTQWNNGPRYTVAPCGIFWHSMEQWSTVYRGTMRYILANEGQNLVKMCNLRWIRTYAVRQRSLTEKAK